MMWDKTANGTVNAAYRSRGIIIELDKEQDKVDRGKKTDADTSECIRKNLVSAMRMGKPLVICCKETLPDFEEKWKLDEKWGITWDEVFNYDEFRNKDNYMKLVKDSENYDSLVNKGKFEMDEAFSITFMCRYVKEDDFYKLLEKLPRHKEYKKVAITNV